MRARARRTTRGWWRGLVRACAIGAAILGSAPPASAQSEQVEDYALDALGSVRVVFDANGTILGRMDYGPFGEELSGATGLPDRRFAGLFRDGEAGLDAAGARSYQVRTGRFSTSDPVYAGIFEPQRWNRYAYALNSPVSISDSSGLLAEGPSFGCNAEFSFLDCGGARVFWAPAEGGYGFDFGNARAQAKQQGYAEGMPSNIWEGLQQYLEQTDSAFFQSVVSHFENGALSKANEGKVLVKIDGKNVDCTVENGCLKLGMVPMSPGAVGAAGERIVGGLANIGDKVKILVSGRFRIPDGMLPGLITEVKNVAYQAYTLQLRDLVQYAKQTGTSVDLWVRMNPATGKIATSLSGPLQSAIDAHLINIRLFPWVP